MKERIREALRKDLAYQEKNNIKFEIPEKGLALLKIQSQIDPETGINLVAAASLMRDAIALGYVSSEERKLKEAKQQAERIQQQQAERIQQAKKIIEEITGQDVWSVIQSFIIETRHDKSKKRKPKEEIETSIPKKFPSPDDRSLIPITIH